MQSRYNSYICRRKFRSQTSDNRDRWKEEMGRVREEKRRLEERRSTKRKSQKKEDPGARKGRKVAKNCVFPMICGSGGSKSRLAKAAAAEPCGQMRYECGAKYIWKSTCTKHTILGPLLEVVMSKKCTPFWREAGFEVKSVKNWRGSEHFWKLRWWKSARRCGAKHISKSNVQNTPRSEHFWKLKCWKSARCCGAKHISKSKVQKKLMGTEHSWTFRCRFAWQAQGTVHLVQSEQNMKVL